MGSRVANAYLPEQVSPPGETLQEVLDDRQMSQAELADRTGRPKKTINEIVKGKTAITAETALQLERVLGIPASFWNNLERNYQEFLARQQEEELLQESTGWLKEVPVTTLEKYGWIERRNRRVDKVREVLGFFGVASPSEWQQVFQVPQASFRHSASFKSESGALAAWLRKSELDAQEIRCAPFEKSPFQSALGAARALTVEEPEKFVPQLVSLCAAARRLSEAQARSLAENVSIAPGIVVGRLQHERWLPHTHLNRLKVRLEWSN